MTLKFSSHILLVLLLCNAAQAEIKFCRGQYTNRQCKDPTARTLPESSRKAKSPEEIALAKKKNLTTNLKLYAARLKREEGIEPVALEGLDDYCLDPKTSLEDCRVKVDEADKSLKALSYKQQQLKQKQSELEQKEKKTEEKPATETKTPSNTVIVIDRRRHHYGDHHDGHSETPRPTPSQNLPAPTPTPGSDAPKPK